MASRRVPKRMPWSRSTFNESNSVSVTEDAAGANLPQFVKDEFDAFLECGILAHGLSQLRCGDCGHDCNR